MAAALGRGALFDPPTDSIRRELRVLEAGIDVVELASERLSFDVDAPEDLEVLPSLPVGAATAGWIEATAHYAADQPQERRG